MGVSAVVAAFVIGLTSPTLIAPDYSSSGVSCGAAWGGGVRNATESGEASCAAIRSERFTWSVTLAILGSGLLVGSVVLSAQRRGLAAKPAAESGAPQPVSRQEASVPSLDERIAADAEAGVAISEIAHRSGLSEEAIRTMLSTYRDGGRSPGPAKS